MEASRTTTYSKGICPISMEDSTVFQLNKHKACICAHTLAVVPCRSNHTHSSNGVLFLVNTKGVWITCLKDQCTASLNKNWDVYRTRARCVEKLMCKTRDFGRRRGGELLYVLLHSIPCIFRMPSHPMKSFFYAWHEFWSRFGPKSHPLPWIHSACRRASDAQGYIKVLPPGCSTGTAQHRVHIDDIARRQSLLRSGNGKKIWVELTKDVFTAHMKQAS
jgi:hypothetical protein